MIFCHWWCSRSYGYRSAPAVFWGMPRAVRQVSTRRDLKELLLSLDLLSRGNTNSDQDDTAPSQVQSRPCPQTNDGLEDGLGWYGWRRQAKGLRTEGNRETWGDRCHDRGYGERRATFGEQIRFPFTYLIFFSRSSSLLCRRTESLPYEFLRLQADLLAAWGTLKHYLYSTGSRL